MRKKVLVLFSFLLFCSALVSQIPNDSLLGFDLAATMREAHMKALSTQEAKFFIKIRKREFINGKYKIETKIGEESLRKYNPGTIMNSPCVDEDFESLSTGTLSSTAWTAQISNNTSGVSVPCATSAITYTNDNTYALILNTPLSDGNCGGVSASPFGGSKILRLNAGNFTTRPTRVSQTFSVTSTNFIYAYAYKGVLNAGGSHTCCELPTLYFNFYNCSGNVNPFLSFTVIPTTCVFGNPDASQWVYGTNGVYYTPEWVVRNADLSAYIGSCVTVEVKAAGCMYTGHEGYVYYDAQCTTSLSPAYVGGSFTPTYATCSQTVNLSGPGGLAYSWQGPASSGVSGSTLATVHASVSGTYTLTSTSGSLSTTNTLNLTIYPVPNITLAASSASLCAGETVTLVANAQVPATYTWNSTGPVSNIYTVIPQSGMFHFYATGQTTAGCIATAGDSLFVAPGMYGVLGQSASSVCLGGQTTLTAYITLSNSTVLWNTGAQTTSITVTPAQTSVYSFTASSQYNCKASYSTQITVFGLPTLQVTVSPPSVCVGGSVNITATPGNYQSYYWLSSQGGSYGSASGPIFPTQSDGYTITASDANGCKGSASTSVIVNALPTVSIVTTPSTYCAGESTTLSAMAAGIVSYSWTLGALTPTPGTAMYTFTPTPGWWNYKVTVTNSLGCTNWASIYPEFHSAGNVVNISTNTNPVCLGEPVTLSAYGDNISAYHWSTGDDVPTIVVTPTITSIYTLTSIGDYNCPVTNYFTLEVEHCDTGLEEYKNGSALLAWPNPSEGTVSIRGTDVSFVLFNSLGQVIRQLSNIGSSEVITISGLEAGVYYLRSGEQILKLIIKNNN
jgi:hypothetical protein